MVDAAGDETTGAGDEIVEQVSDDRRRFVRRLVTGAAFAVPVVSSFDMTSLSTRLAASQTNQTSP